MAEEEKALLLCGWVLSLAVRVVPTRLTSWFHPIIYMQPPCPVVGILLSFPLHERPEPGCNLSCVSLCGGVMLDSIVRCWQSVLGPLLRWQGVGGQLLQD